MYRTEHLPLVVINFASDDIYLSKGETMGFMQIQPLEISEIMTETSTSSIIYEMMIMRYSMCKRENLKRKM